jgi:hypothetical protein
MDEFPWNADARLIEHGPGESLPPTTLAGAVQRFMHLDRFTRSSALLISNAAFSVGGRTAKWTFEAAEIKKIAAALPQRDI